MNQQLTSKLHFVEQKPNRKFWQESIKLDPKSTVIFFDKKLKNQSVVSALLSQYPFHLGLSAGEKLKTFSEIERLGYWLTQQRDLSQSVSDLNFVVVGGGSLGDAVGFLAGVYKRGVRWVNIPTTWLSAVDSAHGGKTAINLKSIKNQLGLFYAPSDVVLIKSLLLEQPALLTRSALGEVAKTVYLSKLVRDPGAEHDFTSNMGVWQAEDIWSHLEKLIQVKISFVQKDPFEKTGFRSLLNWGHTVGHVLEAVMGKPHGLCVGQGLLAEMYLSHFLGKLSLTKLNDHFDYLSKAFGIQPERWVGGLSKGRFLKLLKNDKKAQNADTVNVALLHDNGKIRMTHASVETIWLSYKSYVKDFVS